MGFEQLAELRQQLAAQAKQTKQGKPAPVKSTPAKPKAVAARAKVREPREPVDPLVELIWRLQKHFPQAFPKKPAPKVPLKLGILKDAALHLEKLGMTEAQLQQAIATWCQGSRYWGCLVENAQRVDLEGQAAGNVTAQQAAHARRQASRRPQGKAAGGRERQPRKAEGAPDQASQPEPAQAVDATASPVPSAADAG